MKQISFIAHVQWVKRGCAVSVLEMNWMKSGNFREWHLMNCSIIAILNNWTFINNNDNNKKKPEGAGFSSKSVSYIYAFGKICYNFFDESVRVRYNYAWNTELIWWLKFWWIYKYMRLGSSRFTVCLREDVVYLSFYIDYVCDDSEKKMTIWIRRQKLSWKSSVTIG